MVSTNIQGLGLNDELLRHYKEEMALGILDGKPFDSPVHEGILLTCMLELLPYDDSDKSEFPSTWPFVSPPSGAWGVALLAQLSQALPGAQGHMTYLTAAQLNLPLPPALLAHQNSQLPPSAGGHPTQSYPLQGLETPAL